MKVLGQMLGITATKYSGALGKGLVGDFFSWLRI